MELLKRETRQTNGGFPDRAGLIYSIVCHGVISSNPDDLCLRADTQMELALWFWHYHEILHILIQLKVEENKFWFVATFILNHDERHLSTHK